jgi:hypothetical protein
MKTNLTPTSPPYTKINLQKIVDLHIKAKAINLSKRMFEQFGSR